MRPTVGSTNALFEPNKIHEYLAAYWATYFGLNEALQGEANLTEKFR